MGGYWVCQERVVISVLERERLSLQPEPRRKSQGEADAFGTTERPDIGVDNEGSESERVDTKTTHLYTWVCS